MTDDLVPWALIHRDVDHVVLMRLKLGAAVSGKAWELTDPERRHLLGVVDDPDPVLRDGTWIIDPPTLVCRLPIPAVVDRLPR